MSRTKTGDIVCDVCMQVKKGRISTYYENQKERDICMTCLITGYQLFRETLIWYAESDNYRDGKAGESRWLMNTLPTVVYWKPDNGIRAKSALKGNSYKPGVEDE